MRRGNAHAWRAHDQGRAGRRRIATTAAWRETLAPCTERASNVAWQPTLPLLAAPPAAAHSTTPQEFEDTLRINLLSSFGVLRAAAKTMMRRENGPGGSIVFCSSAVARHGIPNHEAIAAAKVRARGGVWWWVGGGVVGAGRGKRCCHALECLPQVLSCPGQLLGTLPGRARPAPWQGPAAHAAVHVGVGDQRRACEAGEAVVQRRALHACRHMPALPACPPWLTARPCPTPSCAGRGCSHGAECGSHVSAPPPASRPHHVVMPVCPDCLTPAPHLTA